MSKTHLYGSSDPAKEGSDLIAICGQLVKDAAFVFMWDELLMDDIPMMPFSTCKKCVAVETEGRYIYGIRSGQENILQSESHAL